MIQFFRRVGLLCLWTLEKPRSLVPWRGKSLGHSCPRACQAWWPLSAATFLLSSLFPALDSAASLTPCPLPLSLSGSLLGTRGYSVNRSVFRTLEVGVGLCGSLARGFSSAWDFWSFGSVTLPEASWWGWELGQPCCEPVLGSGPSCALDCPGSYQPVLQPVAHLGGNILWLPIAKGVQSVPSLPTLYLHGPCPDPTLPPHWYACCPKLNLCFPAPCLLKRPPDPCFQGLANMLPPPWSLL